MAPKSFNKLQGIFWRSFCWIGNLFVHRFPCVWVSLCLSVYVCAVCAFYPCPWKMVVSYPRQSNKHVPLREFLIYQKASTIIGSDLHQIKNKILVSIMRPLTFYPSPSNFHIFLLSFLRPLTFVRLSWSFSKKISSFIILDRVRPNSELSKSVYDYRIWIAPNWVCGFSWASSVRWRVYCHDL